MQINISKKRELHTLVCRNIDKPVGYMVSKAKCDFNTDFYNSQDALSYCVDLYLNQI